ncbi:hypothetical protein [Pseudalkalibacillus caeni]|uniref:Uncharacterized protein n=1 Tax=Exobacillus caeni TaxID=2574798 RepID=A0A5R9F374_9BACL|nr:hypothetical protein [Pseudalkalibacillus caeni]TLS36900.1 hypothetical protein FCL54_13165 [Pseudalkalibacillus caeni]
MGVGPNTCAACVQNFSRCVDAAMQLPSVDAQLDALIQCSTDLIACVLELCPNVEPECQACVIDFVNCMGAALQETGEANQLAALLDCSQNLIFCVLPQ